MRGNERVRGWGGERGVGWRRGKVRVETGHSGVDREEDVKRGSQKEQEHLKECRGQVAVAARKAQQVLYTE